MLLVVLVLVVFFFFLFFLWCGLACLWLVVLHALERSVCQFLACQCFGAVCVSVMFVCSRFINQRSNPHARAHTQMFGIMDQMWEEAGIDMRLQPYGCISTGFEVRSPPPLVIVDVQGLGLHFVSPSFAASDPSYPSLPIPPLWRKIVGRHAGDCEEL